MPDLDPNRPLTPDEERHHQSQGEAIRYAIREEEKEQPPPK